MFKYTKEQILSLSISFLIVIALTVVIFFLFKSKSEKTKKIPIMITTILIIISELIKYTILIKSKNYFLVYPTFYCSFLWFWFLIADFTNGKFSDSCEAISFTGSVAMVILLIVNPFSILGNSTESLFSSYLNFHHVLFHALVILHLLLCISLKQYKIKKEYFLYVFIWVLILCAIIIPRAYIMNSNYMDLLSSPIPFLENMRIKYGQIVYNVILISWFLLSLELILFIGYLFSKKHKTK